MTVERQNILDLIGRYRNRYTSCIITCYTFDFPFFENRILPILRSSDVKNVNVFLDGKHLENYLENSIGGEFLTHKSYSLNPIYEPGVFHPKIILLTGIKHGLLIIGSGNVTSSGLSTNDEIWGAFHLNGIESQNAPLFAQIWSYLQQYIQHVKGFNLQKINWIKQYSPWLSEIEERLTDDFISINKNLELKFIGNSGTKVLYRELNSVLPKNIIKKLTIASPYFDDNGLILKQFMGDFQIEKMDCITDKEFGLLPYKLDNDLRKNVPFYDWRGDFKGFKRLHAKIFHFQYENGWEYLYLGSANATINAFGSNITSHKNAEAGILLRRNIGSNYLNELGINVQELTQFELPTKKPITDNIGDIEPKIKTKLRLSYAEINGNRLTLFFLKKVEEKCELNVIDSDGNEVELHDIDIDANEFHVTVKNASKIYKVYLQANGERISNYCLVHNVHIQAKSNPDPTHNELTQIIETLSADPEQDKFIELLSHVDYNWADEETETKNYSKSGTSIMSTEKTESSRQYESISTEEFAALQSVQSRELQDLNNPNIYIADLLSAMSKGLLVPHKSMSDNAEEVLARLSEEEQTGEGEVVAGINYRTRGELEKRAIYNHLNKVSAYFQSKLNDFHKKQLHTLLPQNPLTIKQISNLSTALDLIFIYGGKSYEVLKTEFELSYDEHIFSSDLIVYLASKNKDELIRTLDKYGISCTKEKTKDDIITELNKNSKQVLLEYIHYFEYKYSLQRVDVVSRINFERVHFEVDSAVFPDFKSEISLICPRLLVHQEEYKFKTYKREYFVEGGYSNEIKTGIKKYLIEMLGSFLINSNSSSGFKEYSYDLINQKSLSLRNILFDLGIFLCLNLHWGENTTHIRDLLLLDLLHFILPPEELVVNNIEERINDYYKKCKFKNSNFQLNKRLFIKSTVRMYKSWKKKFDTNKKLLIESKTKAMGKIVFNSRIGFYLLKSSGTEHIVAEKPGFFWNDNYKGNIVTIYYPQANVLVFKND